LIGGGGGGGGGGGESSPMYAERGPPPAAPPSREAVPKQNRDDVEMTVDDVDVRMLDDDERAPPPPATDMDVDVDVDAPASLARPPDVDASIVDASIVGALAPRDGDRDDAAPLEIPFEHTLAECVFKRVVDAHAVVSSLVTRTLLDHLGVETHARAIDAYVLLGAGDFATRLIEGLELAARVDDRATARGGAARQGETLDASRLSTALHAATRESSAASDPLASRLSLLPRDPLLAERGGDDDAIAIDDGGFPGFSFTRERDDAMRRASFSEHDARMVDHVDGAYDVEVRSISHWSPYDRVGVVNADP
jgi:hypothetical protein